MERPEDSASEPVAVNEARSLRSMYEPLGELPGNLMLGLFCKTRRWTPSEESGNERISLSAELHSRSRPAFIAVHVVGNGADNQFRSNRVSAVL